MQITLYHTFDDFEIGYLTDFENQNELSYLKYLEFLHKGYDNYLEKLFSNSTTSITKINSDFVDKVTDGIIESTTKEFYSTIQMRINQIFDILKFIQLEKERVKTTLKLKSNITNQNIEPEQLPTKQVQKIGLLFRSGIIDFLIQKKPKISNNQIAGFLDLLTTERIKQGSIGSHLNKESYKYPIQNSQDKDDLDFILKKYGISPQSE